jgi:hypothetical protein
MQDGRPMRNSSRRCRARSTRGYSDYDPVGTFARLLGAVENRRSRSDVVVASSQPLSPTHTAAAVSLGHRSTLHRRQPRCTACATSPLPPQPCAAQRNAPMKFSEPAQLSYEIPTALWGTPQFIRPQLRHTHIECHPRCTLACCCWP